MFKRGDSWYSDFVYKGERYTKSHGKVSKTLAKEKDRDFRADVAAGRYQAAKNNPAFTKAMDEYLEGVAAKNQPRTYRRYKEIAKYLKEHFGNRKISQIESNEVLMRKYIAGRKAQIRERQKAQGRTEAELSFTTINRELALLRSMFNVLIRAGKARKNPVSLVSFFDEVIKERVLSEDEEDRIFAAIEESDRRYHHLKDIVLIALNTGMRQGEIMAMERDWINLKESLIIVPRHAQKRKRKDKRVPINSEIMPIIKRLLRTNKGTKYLFVNPKTKTRYTSITNAWNGIVKKAGLDGTPGVDRLRFHDLRHTAATKLARKGRDIKFIAQYLGHSDVKTSARYIHYSDEDLKAGAEDLARVPSKVPTVKLVKPESRGACSSVG